MQEAKAEELSAQDAELLTQIEGHATDIKRQIDEKREPYRVLAALNELLDENGTRIC